MTRTTVVHVRDPHDVYIGREMPGRAPSPFANPFRIGPDGNRTEVIEKYEQYLTARLAMEPLLKEKLEALRGRRLACWCKPSACHGDFLVRLLHGEPAPLATQQTLF